jgi:hypothetical protein
VSQFPGGLAAILPPNAASWADTKGTQGTGPHTTLKLLVQPGTVDAGGGLNFEQDTVTTTTYLYELLDQSNGQVAKVAPNWFGVAIPGGVTDFSKPIVFFHPTPNQGGYAEGDYAGKFVNDEPPITNPNGTITPVHRNWAELFEYVDRLGNQLAGAIQKFSANNPQQVVIMPFMTTTIASDSKLGIFTDNWLAIVTDILRDISGDCNLEVTDVVVASFSNGTLYTNKLLENTTQSPEKITQVWDFADAAVSVPDNALDLAAVGNRTLVTYSDPNPPTQDSTDHPNTILLPSNRWTSGANPYTLPPPSEVPTLPTSIDTHHLIRDFMFLHAAKNR